MKRVFVLFGGLYSFDGVVTSAGMNTLVARLKLLPDVIVKSYAWADYKSCFSDQNTDVGKNDRCVLIGYSGGGWRMCTVASMMAKWKEPVDLMIGYDPSPSWNMSLMENKLRDNVKVAVIYKNSEKLWIPLLGQIGGGDFFLDPNNKKTKIIPISIAMNHLGVQYDNTLHDRTIEFVKALPA